MPKVKQAIEFSDGDRWSLLNYSTHDYIASRTLLKDGQAGPGTIMGITALEKMFKTLLIMKNQEIVVDGSGHRLAPMIDKLVHIDGSLFTTDQITFVKHIDKAYKIRYPDNIDPSFRIFLPSLKILENLDLLYCDLMNRNPLNTISPGGRYFDMFFSNGAKKSSLIDSNVFYNINLKGTLSSYNQKCAAYSSNGTSYMEWYKDSIEVKADNDWSEPTNFNK
ncbi:MAG: hypothetical protein IPO78_11120 [Saprospiraceae bacterium]|uniref:Uncharacterized protein n=1 Tax=Candidatus Defluviibacterium haderslevense TaxID=2981993 RepID=A0A9D7SDW3_9BACT|nr:hypothetical protein [Candidatus Defluviibacterium haderslevense]MBK9722149.1 hypothetical protein [Saprospiraceae bacterium]